MSDPQQSAPTAGWTQQPGYGQPPVAYVPYPVPQRTNGLAMASMITSIASFALCGGLPGIVGAILGHVARRQVRVTGEQGDGMALAGIIVGWAAFAISLTLICAYIAFVIFAINRMPTTN